MSVNLALALLLTSAPPSEEKLRQLQAASERCLALIQEAPSQASPERVRTWMLTCKDMFPEPGCGRAFVKAAESTDEKGAVEHHCRGL